MDCRGERRSPCRYHVLHRGDRQSPLLGYVPLNQGGFETRPYKHRCGKRATAGRPYRSPGNVG